MDSETAIINKVCLLSPEDMKKLNDNNYLFIRNFLTDKEINELHSFYNKLNLHHDKTKPNYLYVEPEKSREISETIKSIIHNRFNNFFSSGNLLGGVFMIKNPGQNKEVDFHQDWSLVDESAFSSYNLWCPLTDATEKDGALMLIDKSDKAGLPYRSASLPPLEISYSKKYEPYLKKFNFKAGDALLYNHNMFHGSNNNVSDKTRLAIACGIIPVAADFIYKHWNEENKSIDSYKVDKEFYISHIHEVLSGKIPSNYEVIFSKKFDTRPIITEEMFYSNLKKHNTNFISKLYSLFQK